jgi:hypothetical protein
LSFPEKWTASSFYAWENEKNSLRTKKEDLSQNGDNITLSFSLFHFLVPFPSIMLPAASSDCVKPFCLYRPWQVAAAAAAVAAEVVLMKEGREEREGGGEWEGSSCCCGRFEISI